LGAKSLDALSGVAAFFIFGYLEDRAVVRGARHFTFTFDEGEDNSSK
jgi:hypothetical protein